MNPPERFALLMEKYLDGQASAGEEGELKQMLAADGALRGQFVQTLSQEAALRGIGRAAIAASAGSPHRLKPPPRKLPWPWLRWAASAAAVLLLALGSLFFLNPPAPSQEVARLGEVEGAVFVLAGNDRVPARAGQPLLHGQGLEVSGEDAHAIVRFEDATSVDLRAGTIYAERSGAGCQVKLSGDGFLSVDVAAATPLTLVTPQTEAVVPGGRCSLSLAAESVHIENEDGMPIQLTGRSDGKTLQVPAGQSALVVAGRSPTAPRPAAPRLTKARAVLKDHPRSIAALDFAPDGKRLAAGLGDGTILLWNVESQQVERVYGQPSTAVRDLAFSPNGLMLAACFYDGAVRTWLLADPSSERVLFNHQGGGYAIAFSADGSKLRSIGKDAVVKIWGAGTGSELRTLRGAGSFQSARFSPDGNLFAHGDWHNTVRLFDLTTGKDDLYPMRRQAILTTEPADAPPGARAIFALAFTPDRRLLAAGSGDGTVQLWDIPRRQLRSTIYGHKGRVFAAQFAPDGRTLVTASQDHTVRLWHAETAAELAVISADTRRGNVGRVAISPDGKTLATCDARRNIFLWDLTPMP